MATIDRRKMLKVVFGSAAVSIVGLSLAPTEVESLPLSVDIGHAGTAENLLQNAVVVHRRVRRRVCFWRAGRRICRWRWVAV